MRRPSKSSVALALLGLSAGALGLHAASVQAAGYGQRTTPVVTAVQRALPAVVSIVSESSGSRTTRAMRGVGSGVLVHPEGFVVTNSHVIRGAQRVYVSLAKVTGGRAFQASVLEDDPSHDLALLRIARSEPFPYVALCSTREVLVGETAIAIGNPYGLGDTVTVGIVSAKGRIAALSSGMTIRDLLQTDASINLGNSGGALLNLDGDLIGVNCSIHPSAQGIAFTVSADDVQAMLDRNLGAAGRVPPPGPTIDLEDLEPSEPGPEALDHRGAVPVPPAPTAPVPPTPGPYPWAPSSPSPGPSAGVPAARPPIGLMLKPHDGAVLIASVTPGSNADIAGLQAGDLILDVDGRAYATPQELAKTLTSAPSGRTFFVNIRRAGQRATAIIVTP